MGVSTESEAVPCSRADTRAADCTESEGRLSSVEVSESVRVSGAVLCAYRAASVECGHWDQLRTELALRMEVEPQVLDEITVSDWLDVGSLTALLEAQLVYTDLDVLKMRVRRHLIDAESNHVYAPMLRSWTRSFATPEHMLRALGPLFRAGLRNAEAPLVRRVDDAHVSVQIRGALLASLRASPALCAALEGVLLGLLDLARPRPSWPEVELSFGGDELRAACHF